MDIRSLPAGSDMWMFVKYLMVGVVNTIVGFGIIIFCIEVLDLHPVVANAIGFLIGSAVSFVLNRSFSFRSKVSIATGLPSFVAVVIAGYLLNLAALLAAQKILRLGVYPSQILGVSTYVLAVFFASKWLVFRDAASDKRVQS
jgi:putative flippase GtrA